MLGMAIPLVGFGGALAAGQAETLGLPDSPAMLPIAVMTFFSAALLGFAGVSLLLLLRHSPRAWRPVLEPARSRRRVLPAAKTTAADEPTVSMVTTRLVAFAGSARRVRVPLRA